GTWQQKPPLRYTSSARSPRGGLAFPARHATILAHESGATLRAFWCLASEVRDTSQHLAARASEAGTGKSVFPGAVFDGKFRWLSAGAAGTSNRRHWFARGRRRVGGPVNRT